MFYPSAKVLVRNAQDRSKLLLVKRHVGGSTYYEPAGGKLEIDHEQKVAETLEEGAIREAQEELGVHISIKQHLGSYYFFWKIDHHKCSSCAVFLADIVEQVVNFTGNSDTCELTIEPVWVDCNDIKNGKILIDPSYVGLQDILLRYFR